MTDFVKMHGNGNDFIMLTGPHEVHPVAISRLCSRHTGIGADGLIVVTPISDNTFKMDYWNADGTEAEMCGNGLRCSVRYAVDKKLVKPGEIIAQTPVGDLKAEWDGKNPREITVQVGKVTNHNEVVSIEDYDFHTADVGNPHAIAFVQNLDEIDVADVGSRVELNDAFPHKTNVEFVQVDGNRLRVGIWERGSGLTLACGTGMVSCAVISHELGKIKLPTTVEVPGGEARIWIDDDGYACMRAPAEVVYSGKIEL